MNRSVWRGNGRPPVVACDRCPYAGRGWPAFRKHQVETHDRGVTPEFTDAQRSNFYYYRHQKERVAYQTKRNRRLYRTSAKFRAARKAKYQRWWKEKSKDPAWRAARVVKERERMARLRIEDPAEWKRQSSVRRGRSAWQRIGHGNYRAAVRNEGRNRELRVCGSCRSPIVVVQVQAEERPMHNTNQGTAGLLVRPVGLVSYCPKCGPGYPPPESILREQLARRKGRAEGRFLPGIRFTWDASEAVRRSWATRRRLYGPNGWKPGMEHAGWPTRRAKYGPKGHS